MLLAPLAGGAGIYALERQIGPPPLEAADNLSTIVVDRRDKLLRAFTTTQGRWRLPVEVGDVDERYMRMLLAYEDRRFYKHGGVDPIAILRAGWLLVRHRKLMSGGSTLTMQAARLLDGTHERTLAGKLRQMRRARQLEARLSKSEILRLYLRLAPFGGNLEGVRAASLAYFGKEPKRLSVGEAALLVALPQAPGARRPDRHPQRAERARAKVLKRVLAAGVINAAEAKRALAERMPRRRIDFPKFAPHLAESEIAAAPRQRVHRLTIDRAAQAQLEELAHDHAALLGRRLSAALLAIDHASGEVIAHVGAADYFDADRFGGIDMVDAIRSPGSTLKPFIYGLAFEAGLAHPETLIEDRRVHFGSYAPKNFDEKFHGTVTVRDALAQSLNVPAVKLLHAVGPSRLLGRFRRMGTLAPFAPGTEATLALALGGIGLSMKDLGALYASLAVGGKPVKLFHRRGGAQPVVTLTASKTKYRRPVRLLSPVAAWYVTDILKDAPPPVAAKSGRIAYKTGTSYGFRDAWAAGFDGRHTIIAWVGRPDGTSTPSLTGRTAAAPLLFDAFARLSQQRARLPRAPRGALRVSGSDLPPPLKRFGSEVGGSGKGPFVVAPLRIAFPPDRVELEVEESDGGSTAGTVPANDPIMLKAEGGVLPLTWLIDGKPLKAAPHRRETTWAPEGRGFVNLTVIDARGQVDRVTVRFR